MAGALNDEGVANSAPVVGRPDGGTICHDESFNQARAELSFVKLDSRIK
jgi:hypothetical protein